MLYQQKELFLFQLQVQLLIHKVESSECELKDKFPERLHQQDLLLEQATPNADYNNSLTGARGCHP